DGERGARVDGLRVPKGGRERVAVACLVDAQIRERGHAGHRGHRPAPRERGGLGDARVVAERNPDGAREVRRLVAEGVVRGDLHCRLDRAVLHRDARRYRTREHGAGRGHDDQRPTGVGTRSPCALPPLTRLSVWQLSASAASSTGSWVLTAATRRRKRRTRSAASNGPLLRLRDLSRDDTPAGAMRRVRCCYYKLR